MSESSPESPSLLARGVGRWQGAERLAPAPWAPDGLDARGTTHGYEILGGRGLASDYEQTVDGEVTLTAHTVIRIEGDRGLRMYFHSEPGGAPTEMAGRVEGNALVFEGPGPGGRMRQIMRYSPEVLEVVSESWDADSDAWREVFLGRYDRVE